MYMCVCICMSSLVSLEALRGCQIPGAAVPGACNSANMSLLKEQQHWSSSPVPSLTSLDFKQSAAGCACSILLPPGPVRGSDLWHPWWVLVSGLRNCGGAEQAFRETDTMERRKRRDSQNAQPLRWQQQQQSHYTKALAHFVLSLTCSLSHTKRRWLEKFTAIAKYKASRSRLAK